MELEYCENIEAEIPVMFIDKAIGDSYDDKGKVIEKGIDGNKFMKEMLFLSDTLNKKTIDVWINSPGGLVTEGMSIYHGMLQSKADVNTFCYGIAASISGVIFQAGKVRTMTDFAKLMYHPAYNPDGTKDKGLKAMNDSVITMIASRTGKTSSDVWDIMNAGSKDDKGTWFAATGKNNALEMGLCDVVQKSSDANVKKFAEASTLDDKWLTANRFYNRITEPKKINKMKLVANKLNLNEDANEQSYVLAIDAMNKKAADDYSDLQNKFNKKSEEMDALNKEMNEIKASLDTFKKEKADADIETLNKAKLEVKAKAETELTAAVAVGKIKNEAVILDKWRALFEKDFDGTKALVDEMNANSTAPKFTTKGAEANIYTAQTIMHNINKKLNQTK